MTRERVLPWLLLCGLAIPAQPSAQTPRAGQRSRRSARADADAARAISLFSAALAENPADVDAWLNLAAALGRLERTVEAETALRRAIGLAPTQAAAYARLGELLSRDPRRWQRRDEVLGVLMAGLSRCAGDAVGKVELTVSIAGFERSIGRTAAARRRLEALLPELLSPPQRARVLNQIDALRTEERANALMDWPAPAVSESERHTLATAEAMLGRGDAERALTETQPLVGAHPDWMALYWLRGRAWETLGRYDHAQRALNVVVTLAPSHARAWRHLGLVLARHGGLLDAERADEALRQALVLEPGWWDLWLVRAEVAARRGLRNEAEQSLERYRQMIQMSLRQDGLPSEITRDETAIEQLLAALRAQEAPTQGPQPAVAPGTPAAPTERARELYHQAQQHLLTGDPNGEAPALLTAALQDSPGFLAAAVTGYAVLGWVSERTVRTLWNDGQALLDLARRVRALGQTASARERVTPWVDRAIALGVAEAYFERALLRSERGERNGALADLRAYVALMPGATEVAQAQLLRSTLGEETMRDPALVQARLRLLADQAQEAVEALGGPCDDKQDPNHLLELGIVAEWNGELDKAAQCYQRASARPHARGDAPRAAADPPQRRAVARLAALAGRLPAGKLPALVPLLTSAANQGMVAAEWALARLALVRGETSEALMHVERFLAAGDPEAPERREAQAVRERLIADQSQSRRRLRQWQLMLAGLVLVSSAALLWRWLRGVSLERALAQRPALYPELSRVIAELRHDVLKHRTSVLGMLVETPQDAARRGEVERMFWQPERASACVAATYQRLGHAAAGLGLTLRRLEREPVFGALVRDLRHAETLLARMQPSNAVPTGLRLKRIDRRLREVHAERLAALLRLAPRTRVDATQLYGWIRDVETELRVRGQPWHEPVLELHRAELDVPVEPGVLRTIFINLLRNAQAAVTGTAPGGEVLVRMAEERDALGRRQWVLLVGDSAPTPLTQAMIESRESGRGLAIVRDLVREWRGSLAIRSESAPWHKSVGVCFPA